MTYGGIIVSLRVPDRAGNLGDVVLGYESLAGYLTNPSYFGAIIGRYANRIAKGRFTLDGTTYKLAVNNGPNHLHGGIRGFDKVVWQAQPISAAGGQGVAFSHTSSDGDEGYPGTLTCRVQYLLTDRDELLVDYEATTEAPTHVNLTQHSYFNLAGAGSGEIRGHELMIAADSYTAVDAGLIPTGAIAPVAGTSFDFRRSRAIGDEEYDLNFVLRGGGAPGPVHAARVAEPITGRTLDVFTTEPGLQFYTGLRSGGGFCLETQHFPDSPNQPGFPSTILRPGQRYQSRTVFAFGVEP